jgi:glutamate:GABA antiporter
VVRLVGLWWTGSGRHSQIPFHPAAVLPAWHGLASLVYAAGIVVAFAGMEIGGFYSHVTRNVTRTYPRAVLIAGAGVVGALFTFFLGFIPATHLSTSGTIAYVAVMAFGMIAIVGTPFLLHRGPALKTDTQPDPNLVASQARGRV